MDNNIITEVKKYPLDTASTLAFISVETGGQGFDKETHKITIQFEPAWFKKQAPYAPSGKWSVNKVEVQAKEWIAFNDAYSKNPEAAMKSTSIGLGQIMGFHYKRLGYATVNDMWDDAKKGIARQVYQLVKFINTDNNLKIALMNCEWSRVATIYNGSGYQQLALKYGCVPYDEAIFLYSAAEKVDAPLLTKFPISKCRFPARHEYARYQKSITV